MAKTQKTAAPVVTNLADMTMDQLEALRAKLDATRVELENKSQTMQIIVTKDSEALKHVANAVRELVIPNIEFDMRLMKDVVLFNAWATDASKGRMTIGFNEFKHIVRAVSATKWRGANVAIALDSLNDLLEEPAASVQQFEQQYRENATALDACLNEIDKRKAAEQTAEQSEATQTETADVAKNDEQTSEAGI